jgi:hypothetical protein
MIGLGGPTLDVQGVGAPRSVRKYGRRDEEDGSRRDEDGEQPREASGAFIRVLELRGEIIGKGSCLK